MQGRSQGVVFMVRTPPRAWNLALYLSQNLLKSRLNHPSQRPQNGTQPSPEEVSGYAPGFMVCPNTSKWTSDNLKTCSGKCHFQCFFFFSNENYIFFQGHWCALTGSGLSPKLRPKKPSSRSSGIPRIGVAKEENCNSPVDACDAWIFVFFM